MFWKDESGSKLVRWL